MIDEWSEFTLWMNNIVDLFCYCFVFTILIRKGRVVTLHRIM